MQVFHALNVFIYIKGCNQEENVEKVLLNLRHNIYLKSVSESENLFAKNAV